MKIIKTSTYNDLIECKRNYGYLTYDFIKLKLELLSLREYKQNQISNLKIRKVITGCKGSGKTHFLKNVLLPQLTNYFLIDLNDEYKSVSNDCKYICDSSISIETHKTNIENIISKNKDKTIIFDEVGFIGKQQTWLINMLSDQNFILITQQINYLLNYMYCIDTIYNFETIEMHYLFKEKHKHKIQNYPKYDFNTLTD